MGSVVSSAHCHGRVDVLIIASRSYEKQILLTYRAELVARDISETLLNTLTFPSLESHFMIIAHAGTSLCFGAQSRDSFSCQEQCLTTYPSCSSVVVESL